jgi:DNA-binding MarR family transcriptional regulator
MAAAYPNVGETNELMVYSLVQPTLTPPTKGILAMSTPHDFSPQILGQTEKALNAILDRQLADSGVTEPQWVTLVLSVTGGGSIDHEQLVTRVSDALKVDEDTAEVQISGLAAAHLLDASDVVQVTDAGHRLYAQVRAATAEITERMWGDLPEEDLATTGRVLSTILERANAELAG